MSDSTTDAIAVLCSMFMPGLGHAAKGHFMKAIGFAIAAFMAIFISIIFPFLFLAAKVPWFVSILAFLAAPVVWAYAIKDAYEIEPKKNK